MLFPSTDAGVGLQAIVVVLVTVVGLWLARRSTDGMMFLLGLFVMTAAVFGLRTLH